MTKEEKRVHAEDWTSREGAKPLPEEERYRVPRAADFPQPELEHAKKVSHQVAEADQDEGILTKANQAIRNASAKCFL